MAAGRQLRLCVLLGAVCATGTAAVCQSPPPASAQTPSHSRGKTMHATGTFQVTMGKADASPIGQAAGVGRMTIDKVWSGAIAGTSKGEMLSAAEANGAMVYVALEKMDVTVDGKKGTFLFRHGATMMMSDPATAALEVTVVPQTGTGELAGIEGRLSITIDKSGHSYAFDYTLPGA